LNAVGTVRQNGFSAQLPTPALDPVNVKKRCEDFFDQDDVQKYYIAQGGPESDPDDLDLDNDGQACENYPYSTSSDKAPDDKQS